MAQSGYSKKPLVETDICGIVKLSSEIEIQSLSSFVIDDFTRKKYLRRILEAKKRSVDVVTLDEKYLSFNEYFELTGGE
jgi:hypothetical protein